MVSGEIANYAKFQEAIARGRAAVQDLTVPLMLIAKDFYRSEKAIFQLSGPGQYPDLSPKYKKQKQKRWGRIYPILMASGALRDSVTSGSDKNSISQVVNRTSLIIGTRVEYAAYLQEGTMHMPARPFLFIGPESRYANSEQQGRVGRWMNILNAYVLRAMGESVTLPEVGS